MISWSAGDHDSNFKSVSTNIVTKNTACVDPDNYEGQALFQQLWEWSLYAATTAQLWPTVKGNILFEHNAGIWGFLLTLKSFHAVKMVFDSNIF